MVTVAGNPLNGDTRAAGVQLDIVAATDITVRDVMPDAQLRSFTIP